MGDVQEYRCLAGVQEDSVHAHGPVGPSAITRFCPLPVYAVPPLALTLSGFTPPWSQVPFRRRPWPWSSVLRGLSVASLLGVFPSGLCPPGLVPPDQRPLGSILFQTFWVPSSFVTSEMKGNRQGVGRREYQDALVCDTKGPCMVSFFLCSCNHGTNFNFFVAFRPFPSPLQFPL